MSFPVEFVRDLADRSAARSSAPNWGVETLTTLGVGLLAASAQAEAIRKLAEPLGNLSNAVQVLLLLGAILWCAAIVSAKAPTPAAPDLSAECTPTTHKYIYVYSQYLRTLAKVAILAAVTFVPFKVSALADEWIPLPDMVYGIVDDFGGHPIENVRLRLVSSRGEDITSGSWFTDSHGFYAVRATRRLRRSDAIRLAPQGCKTEQTLTLARTSEAPATEPWPPGVNNGSPRFLHHINCEGK